MAVRLIGCRGARLDGGQVHGVEAYRGEVHGGEVRLMAVLAGRQARGVRDHVHGGGAGKSGLLRAERGERGGGCAYRKSQRKKEKWRQRQCIQKKLMRGKKKLN